MKTNLEITQNKELKVSVDLSVENEGTTVTPNVYVSKIQIFNTHSFLDDNDVYQHEYNNDFPNVFTITENELNTYAYAKYGNSNYQTNIFNDIMVVRLEFEYDQTYESEHDCNELPREKTLALYYPCFIYGNAMSKVGNCNCKDMCEDNLPYGFMYELLKKKVVDINILSGNIDIACRYFIKFYSQNTCSHNASCGCQTENSVSNQSKNCGCNGNS